MPQATNYLQDEPDSTPDRSRVNRWFAIGWAITFALMAAAAVRVLTA